MGDKVAYSPPPPLSVQFLLFSITNTEPSYSAVSPFFPIHLSHHATSLTLHLTPPSLPSILHHLLSLLFPTSPSHTSSSSPFPPLPLTDTYSSSSSPPFSLPILLFHLTLPHSHHLPPLAATCLSQWRDALPTTWLRFRLPPMPWSWHRLQVSHTPIYFCLFRFPPVCLPASSASVCVCVCFTSVCVRCVVVSCAMFYFLLICVCVYSLVFFTITRLSPSLNFLRLSLTQNLKWKCHISLTKSASSRLDVLYHPCQFFSPAQNYSYTAFLFSLVEYVFLV